LFYGFVTLRVSLESVVSGASARAAFVEKRSSRSDTKKRTSAHRRTRTIRLRSRARRIGRSRLRVWDVPGGGRSNARAALVDDSMPVARSAAPAPNARRVTRGATESDRREMGSAHLVMCDRRDAERDAERRDGAARATPPAATQREKAIDAMGRNVRTGREARLVWCAATDARRRYRWQPLHTRSRLRRGSATLRPNFPDFGVRWREVA